MQTYNPFILRAAQIVEYAKLHNLSIMDAADQFITANHWHRTAELMQDYRRFLSRCRGKSLEEIRNLRDD